MKQTNIIYPTVDVSVAHPVRTDTTVIYGNGAIDLAEDCGCGVWVVPSNPSARGRAMTPRGARRLIAREPASCSIVIACSIEHEAY